VLKAAQAPLGSTEEAEGGMLVKDWGAVDKEGATCIYGENRGVKEGRSEAILGHKGDGVYDRGSKVRVVP
jgi:hypothetical protein